MKYKRVTKHWLSLPWIISFPSQNGRRYSLFGMQLRWLIATTFLLLVSYSNSLSCRNYGGKTYQMQITYGDFIGSEFVTLESNNVARANDNTENGITPGDVANGVAYTSQQGKWQCIGRDRVRIRTIAFNLRRENTSDPSSYFLVKRIWTFSGSGNKAHGIYNYIYYLDGTFPLDPNAQPLPNSTFGPYPTSGRRFDFF